MRLERSCESIQGHSSFNDVAVDAVAWVVADVAVGAVGGRQHSSHCCGLLMTLQLVVWVVADMAVCLLMWHYHGARVSVGIGGAC